MTDSILQPWIDKGLVEEPPLILEDGTVNPEAVEEDNDAS